MAQMLNVYDNGPAKTQDEAERDFERRPRPSSEPSTGNSPRTTR